MFVCFRDFLYRWWQLLSLKCSQQKGPFLESRLNTRCQLLVSPERNRNTDPVLVFQVDPLLLQLLSGHHSLDAHLLPDGPAGDQRVESETRNRPTGSWKRIWEHTDLHPLSAEFFRPVKMSALVARSCIICRMSLSVTVTTHLPPSSVVCLLLTDFSVFN